jgi:diguanylate cyclase (GGDEF)-like protein
MTYFDESLDSQIMTGRILVVTDRRPGVEGVAELLVSAGFTDVRTVCRVEGTDVVGGDPPDAVVLDLTGPAADTDGGGWGCAPGTAYRAVGGVGGAVGGGGGAVGGGGGDVLGGGDDVLGGGGDVLGGGGAVGGGGNEGDEGGAERATKVAGRAAVPAGGVPEMVTARVGDVDLPGRLRLLLAVRFLRQRVQDLSRQLTRLRAQQARAVAESTFLHAVVDNIEECVVACDDDGRPAFANRSAVRLGLGVPTTGQVAALAGDRLRSAAGEKLSAVEDPLQRAWAGQEVVDQEVSVVVPGLGRRTFVANSRPMLVDPGRRLGAVVALHDVTEQRRLIEELRRGMLRDEVTGLLNLALFLEAVERATARAGRDHRPVAVLSIVVDVANATELQSDGGVGDPVLAALGRRLPALLRPGDVAARYRDGFAVMCEAPVDEVHARLIGDRVRVGLCRPVEVAGRVLTPRMSLGVRTSRGCEAGAEELLQDALVAALWARQHGRPGPETLESAPREGFLRAGDLAAELHHALPWGEFQVHYQPMIDLGAGCIVGAEALSRWPRPGRGPVLPERFLPVATQTGMLARLEAWVLRTVCEQLAAWQAGGLLGERFSVSVNVSPQRVVAQDWPEEVLRTVEETGADPRRLVLEITREAFAEDQDRVLQALAAVQAHRIRFALDDVGARPPEGLLRRFPIEVLKVGRAVVSAMTGPGPAAGRAAELIELARRFGLVTVATGVETARQASALVGMGCQQAQGHYFGEARPAERFTALMASPR